jgi:hypothetical protein
MRMFTIDVGNVSYYCPEGSAKQSPVHTHFYSIATPPGVHFNEDELWAVLLRPLDNPFVAIDTAPYRTDQVRCPLGSYCTNATRFLCPPGTFGNSTDNIDSNCTGTVIKCVAVRMHG